jgi:hypothetical protein
VGPTVNEIVARQDRVEKERCVVTRALEKGFSSYEPIRRAKDRSLRYVDISSKAIRNERRAVDFMLDSTDDVVNIEFLRHATLV